MTTNVTRPPSPIIASPQVSLEEAFDALRKVTLTLSKPDEERLYLGKGFKVLDYITSINNPTEVIKFEECSKRLQELVAASNDKDKKQKQEDINLLLNLIFKQRSLSPASNSSPNKVKSGFDLFSSDPEFKAADEKSSKRNAKANKRFEQFEMIVRMHQARKNEGNKSSQASLPFLQQLQQKQKELSTLLLICDFIHIFRQWTSAMSDIIDSTEQVTEFGSTTSLVGDDDDPEKFYFSFDPETEEGIAFLCKWSKILKAKNEKICLDNSSDLFSSYYHELQAVAAQSTGEVQKMASLICNAMKWDFSNKMTDKFRELYKEHESLLLTSLDNPLGELIVEYSNPWILKYLKLSPSRSSAPVSQQPAYTASLMTFTGKLLAQRDKLLVEYRKNYEAFQALGQKARDKLVWFQHNKTLFPTSLLGKSTGFPSPDELAQRSAYTSYSPPTAPEKLEEKQKTEGTNSSAKSKKKKGKGKKKNKTSSQQAKSSSSSDVQAAKSSPAEASSSDTQRSSPSKSKSSETGTSSNASSSLPSYASSSLSLQESDEGDEMDSSMDSNSPRRYSSASNDNFFSSLDLSSPKASSLAKAPNPDLTEKRPSPSLSDSERSASSSPSSPSLQDKATAYKKENSISTPFAKEKKASKEASLPRSLSSSSINAASNDKGSSSPYIAHPRHAVRKNGHEKTSSNTAPSSPEAPAKTIAPLRSSMSFDSPADLKGGHVSSSPSKLPAREKEFGRNSPTTSPSSVSIQRNTPSPSRTSAHDIFAGSFQQIIYDRRVVLQRKNTKDWGHNFPSDFDRLVGGPYSRKTEWPDHRTQAMQPHYEIFCKMIPKGAKNEKENQYFVMEYCFNQKKRCYHRFARDEKTPRSFTDAVIKRKRFQVENPTPAESMQLKDVVEEAFVVNKAGAFNYKIVSSQEIVQFFDKEGNEYHVYKME